MSPFKFIMFAGLLGGCASQQEYPQEGNISREQYQHVSGVNAKRNATSELMTVVAAGAGTASGYAAAGKLTPATVPQVTQKALLNVQHDLKAQEEERQQQAARP